MTNRDTAEPANEKAEKPADFIRAILQEDERTGRYGGRVVTRFPPEPNGYLHIGHAKAICLDFGVAEQFGGACNLRFDDTNPTKEEIEYTQAIIEDIRWLGFDWKDRLYFASDYFEKLCQWGEHLIRAGKAYVCDLTADEIRAYRGTLTEPGRNSPYRDRPVDENLDLFRRMKAGEFPDGSRVLRAKIDMGSPNLNLRDPVLYRILHATHPHAGDQWRIYPMYDYAHPLSDAIEGITHSMCSLEFEDHRPLYDWCIDEAGVAEPHPQQIEFARLNITYTVLSKRKLLQLVQEKHVEGWSDPRMPTLRGLRRRGYPPEAIRAFCERIGVAKRDSMVDVALLEHTVREHLNKSAPRAMAVLRPIKVVLTNYPDGQVDQLPIVNNPEDDTAGTRMVPFSRALWIEEDDFREVPPPKYHRLSPGVEVRLRGAYLIRCEEVVKDPATGAVIELRCTYDPATRGGAAPDGRKVKSTIHWVSAAHAGDAEVRLYEHLFRIENPGAGDDFLANLNPDSLTIVRGCKIEPMLVTAAPGSRWQFERIGYFCVDSEDSRPGSPVFNRTVTLRDTWAKIEKGQGA